MVGLLVRRQRAAAVACGAVVALAVAVPVGVVGASPVAWALGSALGAVVGVGAALVAYPHLRTLQIRMLGPMLTHLPPAQQEEVARASERGLVPDDPAVLQAAVGVIKGRLARTKRFVPFLVVLILLHLGPPLAGGRWPVPTLVFLGVVLAWSLYGLVRDRRRLARLTA